MVQGRACSWRDEFGRDTCTNNLKKHPTATAGNNETLPQHRPARNKKKRPSDESRWSWATWIRTALAVEPIPLKKSADLKGRAINHYHIGSTNHKVRIRWYNSITIREGVLMVGETAIAVLFEAPC